jgi:hypothetical protein
MNGWLVTRPRGMLGRGPIAPLEYEGEGVTGTAAVSSIPPTRHRCVPSCTNTARQLTTRKRGLRDSGTAKLADLFGYHKLHGDRRVTWEACTPFGTVLSTDPNH